MVCQFLPIIIAVTYLGLYASIVENVVNKMSPQMNLVVWGGGGGGGGGEVRYCFPIGYVCSPEC